MSMDKLCLTRKAFGMLTRKDSPGRGIGLKHRNIVSKIFSLLLINNVKNCYGSSSIQYDSCIYLLKTLKLDFNLLHICKIFTKKKK